MPSVVNITPLIDPGCDKSDSYYCTLIEIDQVKILADCGIELDDFFTYYDQISIQDKNSFSYNPRHIDFLSKYFFLFFYRMGDTIDAIILTNNDINFVGGLLFIDKFLKSSCPIFSTIPIQTFVGVTLSEFLNNLNLCFGICSESHDLSLNSIKAPFSKLDLDNIMKRFITLRYFQTVNILSSSDISITAHPSGVNLGGSIWRIKKSPSDDILYSTKFDHKGSFITDGFSNSSLQFKPSLFIISTNRALNPYGNKKTHQKYFFNLLQNAIKQKNVGNTLLVTNSLSRFYETQLIFNEIIKNNSQFSDKVYVLSLHIKELNEIIRSLLEWTSRDLTEKFAAEKINPLTFEKIRFVFENDDIVNINKNNCIYISYTPLLCLPYDTLDHFKNANIIFLSDNQNCSSYSVNLRKKSVLQGKELQNYFKIKEEEEQNRLAEEAFSKLNSDYSNHKTEENMPSGLENLNTLIISASSLKSVLWLEFNQDKIAKSPFESPIFTEGFKFITKNHIGEYGYNAPNLKSSNIDISFLEALTLKDEISHKNLSEKPYKYINAKYSYNLVSNYDFDYGIHMNALKIIINSINPQKIAIYGGNADDREYFKNMILLGNPTSEMVILKYFERKNLSMETEACFAILNESMYKSLIFNEKTTCKLSYSGLIIETATAHRNIELDEKTDNDNISISSAGIHQPLVMGNLKITNLSRQLSLLPELKVSITDGKLMIGDVLKFYKNKEEIRIIGNYDDSFFKIRKSAYSNLVEL